MVSALETGHVDIAVGAYPSLVAGIKTQRLYQEEYLCFGKEGHPFIKRSEEHTSELQPLMRISYAVFCLKKKHTTYIQFNTQQSTISYCYNHISNKLIIV